MSDRIAASRGGWWRTLVFTGAAAALSYAAARLMFSAFMFYDDEGYVLMSLKNFAEHGNLYCEVYSQYGPFPFVFYYLLHEFGLPITHLSGRLITLLAWICTAISCAAIVRQATRHEPTAFAVLAGTFAYLWIMVSEPAHPGGLIAVVVGVAAALGCRWLGAGRIGAWACTTGAAAALLALTKINVGGFVVLAGVSWILLHHESAVVRRRAPLLLICAAVLVPLVLMRPMLEMAWVQTLALVFSCSAIAAVLATDRDAIPNVGWRTLGICCAGGLAATAAVLGVVLARGTTLFDVLEGVLLGPIRHPAAFNLSYTWPPGTAVFAIASLALVVAALQLRRHGTLAIDSAIAGLRLVAVGGVVLAVLRFPDASPDRIVFGYGAPCVWLFLWPLPGEERALQAVVTWLGLLWLGQFLHTYPVAGSQIAWSTFLAVPLAALGGHATVKWFVQRFPRPSSPRISIRALQVALVGLAVAIGVRFSQAGNRYREGSDLELPGAEFLRLPSEATALFRLLAVNAAAHGDMLFSEPGMFSLNFWSGLPTPTLANVTHWFSLLNPARQQAIIRSLETHPRAVVIVAREHIAYLTKRSFAPAGKLHDYIERNFTPAIVLDDFEFRVRAGRHIEPLLLGEMVILSDLPAQENTALKLRVLFPSDRPATRIELSVPPQPGSSPLVLDATNSKIEIVAPAPRIAPWPLRVEGVATLLIHFDRFKQPRPMAGGVITFRAADGSEVALARLKQ